MKILKKCAVISAQWSAITLFVFLLFTVSCFLITPAYAQDTAGVSVTPAILRVDLAHEPSWLELIYKNNSQQDVSLTFSANDFSELEDGWQVKFLDQQQAKDYKYTLASWVEFEKQTITLKSGEEGKVKVSIDQQSLSPGGHYASLLASIAALDSTNKQVEIRGVLSTILFVRAYTGNEVEQLSVSDFSLPHSFFEFPNSGIVRLNNTGNTELVPFGSLELRDLTGKLVGKGILNQGSNYVLPGTVKRFDLKINQLGLSWLPGFYTASLKVQYGDKPEVITQTNRFFYADWKVILGFIGIIAGIGIVTKRTLRISKHH